MFQKKQNKNKNKNVLCSRAQLGKIGMMKTGWINFKFVNIFLVFSIVFCAMYYLTGINDLSVKGYRIKELKKQINRLTNENNNYELSIMDLGSYLKISERAKLAKMVDAGNLEYIKMKTEIVAKK